MPYPIRTCVNCGEEFELRPDKPGFANRCPACSEPEDDDKPGTQHLAAGDRRSQKEIDEERRRVMRDLLYRKDS